MPGFVVILNLPHQGRDCNIGSIKVSGLFQVVHLLFPLRLFLVNIIFTIFTDTNSAMCRVFFSAPRTLNKTVAHITSTLASIAFTIFISECSLGGYLPDSIRLMFDAFSPVIAAIVSCVIPLC